MKNQTIEAISRFSEAVTEAIARIENGKDVYLEELFAAENSLNSALELERELNPFQHRVLEEKRDLDAKRDRLADFICSETFRDLSMMEQSRLNRQLDAMQIYSTVLGERIAGWQL